MAAAYTNNENKGSTATPGNSKIDDIQATLVVLTAKMDNLLTMEHQLEELRKSVMFVSNSFDSFQREIQNLKSENTRLRDELKTTTDKLNDLQQYTCRNTLELTGIPQQEKEDTDAVVVKVAAAAGINITTKDIDISHRLPSRSQQQSHHQPATIIVKFVRRRVRNQIYSARKNLKDKTTRSVGFTSDNRIYINENLTPANKKLFFEANRQRNAKNWKFIWTNNGKTYERKNTGHPAIYVAIQSDLNRII
ncbi:uncharacterized protein [Ptychodera flava]|uniref:uncharacterized protein n=1 Tax=Ptychodera flava TaxID=63121 RepID=UPI00396A3830